jgi:hypothetical protein
MSFDNLDKVIDKFSNECMSDSNSYKNTKECKELFKYIQRNLLPKYIKNKNIINKDIYTKYSDG